MLKLTKRSGRLQKSATIIAVVLTGIAVSALAENNEDKENTHLDMSSRLSAVVRSIKQSSKDNIVVTVRIVNNSRDDILVDKRHLDFYLPATARLFQSKTKKVFQVNAFKNLHAMTQSNEFIKIAAHRHVDQSFELNFEKDKLYMSLSDVPFSHSFQIVERLEEGDYAISLALVLMLNDPDKRFQNRIGNRAYTRVACENLSWWSYAEGNEK